LVIILTNKISNIRIRELATMVEPKKKEVVDEKNEKKEGAPENKKKPEQEVELVSL